jgi:hypothetical protein
MPASERLANVGLPAFIVASLYDNRHDALQLALAAEFIHAVCATSEMRAVSIAFAITGFT